MLRISTRIHGILDLVYAASFLAMPYLLGSKKRENKMLKKAKKALNIDLDTKNSTSSKVSTVMGAAILAQGLTTDHEIGRIKFFPMPQHLAVDLAMAPLMIGAPWIFNMNRRYRAPFVILGVGEIIVTLLTETRPSYRTTKDIGVPQRIFAQDVADIIKGS